MQPRKFDGEKMRAFWFIIDFEFCERCDYLGEIGN